MISNHYVGSEAYWKNEQEILCDVVRVMKRRHRDPEHYPALCTREQQGDPLYYPNVFITIAPGEHKVTRHSGMFEAYAAALHDITGPLCLHIDALFKRQLVNFLKPHFKNVYEWSLRIEFQGRGTGCAARRNQRFF